jgi:hypothetical protein
MRARRGRRGSLAISRRPGPLRPRRRDRSGIDEPAPWRSRGLVRVLTIVTGIVVLTFVLWLGWVVYLYVARGGPSGATFDPDRRCASLGFSCGIVTNLLASGVLVALASAFLLWRLFGLQRRYWVRAREESRELVPTAGAIIDQVVGRDELCLAVMTDLHDRGTRPHLIVGGVGTGKTAVLVRLTEMLAAKRAVPVPIRLRDAGDLDFEALARDRFLSEVNRGLISAAEGETIWRRLRQDGKIIVLADGLEEALAGSAERDTIIREAIRRAYVQRLPLVIASRPHDPLRGTDAAILDLEPLSYEAALAYIGGDGTTEDERRLAWIVETAEVIEAPLYLQVTRELHLNGLLEPTSAGQLGVVDTRGVDRAKLRLSLLETWERALVNGHLRADVPLSKAERQAAVEQMSMLACVGLRTDTLEVAVDVDPGSQLRAEVRQRLTRLDRHALAAPGLRTVDVKLAAAWAAQLNLVEVRGQKVRFPHSLMQAYLGSRLLDAALADPGYAREALDYPRPGQEFLIALVLRSRAGTVAGGGQPGSSAVRAGGAGNYPALPSGAAGLSSAELLVPLRSAVARGYPPAERVGAGQQHDAADRGEDEPVGRGEDEPVGRAEDGIVGGGSGSGGEDNGTVRDDSKVFDMYAAALEIDCFAAEPVHVHLATEIRDRWARIYAQDRRTLEDSKAALVHRLGETARVIDDRLRRGDRIAVTPCYRQLYDIGCLDPAYPVRLAAAQEIGVGGETAYTELRDALFVPCETCAAERPRPIAAGAAGAAAGAAGAAAAVPLRYALPPASIGEWLAAAGTGGSPGEPGSLRAPVLSAWLVPMLVGSTGGRSDAGTDRGIADQAQADLTRWLRHVARDGRRPGEQDLPIALEIALAQGFKYAANRRAQQPDLLRESRMFLAEQTLEMLKGARYWFSQLTLLHALCLLNLSELGKQPWDRYAKPEAIVQHWLDVAGREGGDDADSPGGSAEPHPFVREAARLCVLALKTGRPQRYCWIDETGVVGQVGSRNLSGASVRRQHRLWIPPSAGWTALNGSAQQLLADVLLLLNLADRGEQPHVLERRLRRSNRRDLPPCITSYREALEPGLTVGTAAPVVPGTSCIDGCAFELCPYPPKGTQPRSELSEAFSRRQQTLLTRSLRHPASEQAPWQQMKAAQLNRFWIEMADRARGSPSVRSGARRSRAV